MYRVKPDRSWWLRANKGISRRAVARLTSQMREILYSAMQDAVIETMRTAKMRSRRGAVFNSIMSGLRPSGTIYPSTVGVTFMMRPWVAIHETGGIIQARNGPYMTIPLPSALRADGRLKRRSAAGWRDYKTFVWTSPRTQNKFIVYKDKNSGRLVFLYILKEEIEMQKRLFLYQAIMRQEAAVVAAWYGAVMDIFNSIDLYGIAFQGIKVES